MGFRYSENKAVIFEAKNRIAVRKIPVPELKRGEILIRTQNCTICGSDIRMLKYGHRKVKFPVIAGHEVIGIVEDSRSNNFHRGDKVVIHPRIVCGKCFYCKRGETIHCVNTESIGFIYPGGFASFFKVPARGVKNGNVIKLETLSPIFTLCEPTACVIRVHKHIALEGKILVVGDGPIGALHSYILAKKGKEVYVKSKNRFRENFIKKLGIPTIHRPPSTEKEKFDSVIIAASTKNAVEFGIQSARKGSKTVFFSGIEHPENLSYVINEIHYRELIITGFHASTPDDMKDAIEFLKKHPEIETFITHSYHYTEFRKALKTVEGRLGMKVLIYFHP